MVGRSTDNFPASVSARRSGEPAGRDGGARGAGREGSQSPDQGPGGRAAEGQTRHGQAAPRVPGEGERRIFKLEEGNRSRTAVNHDATNLNQAD